MEIKEAMQWMKENEGEQLRNTSSSRYQYYKWDHGVFYGIIRPTPTTTRLVRTVFNLPIDGWRKPDNRQVIEPQELDFESLGTVLARDGDKALFLAEVTRRGCVIQVSYPVLTPNPDRGEGTLIVPPEDGFAVISSGGPGMYANAVYLPGRQRERDAWIASYFFASVNEAQEYGLKVVEALERYAASVEKRFKVEEADDVESQGGNLRSKPKGPGLRTIKEGNSKPEADGE